MSVFQTAARDAQVVVAVAFVAGPDPGEGGRRGGRDGEGICGDEVCGLVLRFGAGSGCEWCARRAGGGGNG